MSKSKKSSAPAATDQINPGDQLAQLMAMQNFGNPMQPQDQMQQPQQNDMQRLFPALAAIQQFQGDLQGVGTGMKKKAMDGLLGMFGGG